MPCFKRKNYPFKWVKTLPLIPVIDKSQFILKGLRFFKEFIGKYAVLVFFQFTCSHFPSFILYAIFKESLPFQMVKVKKSTSVLK